MKMQEFSIKDLESYTGIKAHTIRIWEQRYGLLSPDRTDTNIRKYTDRDLKYLLNVSLLNNLGYKISQIAGMSDDEVREAISRHALNGQQEHHLMHMLKIAMLNYDEELFSSAVDAHMDDHGLEKTYKEVLIPFLRQIGILWQASVICPAQEHFISSLIRQKMFARVESLRNVPRDPQLRPVVLFLPDLEIHELSLIMVHYLLKLRGRKSIFLGQSVPQDDLHQIYLRLGAVDFVSIFTTNPSTVLIPDYFRKLIHHFGETDCHFHLTGNNLTGLKSPEPSVITLHPSVEELLARM